MIIGIIYGGCMYSDMYDVWCMHVCIYVWYMVYVSLYICLVYVVCMSAYMYDSI